MAIVETIERRTEIIGGKEHPVTITKRKGLDTYTDGGRTFRSDYAVFCDYGPKLGVSRSYSRLPGVEPTQEEREANRRNIIRAAEQAMYDQGLW